MTLARGRASEIVIEATVTRADGRVERLGTVSYWHKSPWKRLVWRLKRMLAWHRL
jgi:hypothetical protein